MESDAGLKQTVLEELEWRPEIQAAHIGVAAENGVVTLTGHVSTFAEKRAVEEAVKHIVGVRGIADDLEVRLPGEGTADDDEIAWRALNLLNWDTSVRGESLQVTVGDGWVTLSGAVPWQFQKTAAENAVRNLHGVVGVVNNITLAPQPQPMDVKERIEGALRRNAELEDQEIRVSVSGETVTLGGTVGSWAARLHAEAAAWAAPGVSVVRNELLVVVFAPSPVAGP